jgi:hypothetical protein
LKRSGNYWPTTQVDLQLTRDGDVMLLLGGNPANANHLSVNIVTPSG